MKNFAAIKNQIMALVETELAPLNLQLYEVSNLQEFDSDVLQILVEDKDDPTKPLDFDLLVKANELLASGLDGLSELSTTYTLELASAGLEKPIRNLEEAHRAIGKYVFAQLGTAVGGQRELYGTLQAVDDARHELVIAITFGSQTQPLTVTWPNIKLLRYEVQV